MLELCRRLREGTGFVRPSRAQAGNALKIPCKSVSIRQKMNSRKTYLQCGSTSICCHAAFSQRRQHLLALNGVFQDGFGGNVLWVLGREVNQRHNSKEGRVHDEPMCSIQQPFLLHLYAQVNVVS